MENLIVCEYCGTAYDAREGRCPTCQGQPGDAKNYMGDHYDYDERPMDDELEKPSEHLFGKILALVCLIALFIGFTGYILYSFELLPFLKPTASDVVPDIIPCTQLAVDATELTLEEEGQSIKLQTAVAPTNTTDLVIFSVDNSAVAGVTQDGTVTAKAPGQATVSILCGSYTAYCHVICAFDGDAAPEPEPEPEPESHEPLTISEEDISFFAASESTALTVSGGDGSVTEWESADESVATVDKIGYVVAVGSGTTEITATVGDEEVTCIVRCQF